MNNTFLNGSKNIRVDDIVLIRYPAGEKTNNPAHRLDGQQFVVKTKYKTNTNKGGDTYQYTLFGAVSKAGVPYTFLTDELIRL